MERRGNLEGRKEGEGVGRKKVRGRKTGSEKRERRQLERKEEIKERQKRLYLHSQNEETEKMLPPACSRW